MVRVSIHGELDQLSHFDFSDIGLVHVRIDLHAGQILGDAEEGRRLEARGHRLSDVHIPGNDDPVHRRKDAGVVQIGLLLLQGRALLFHLRLRQIELGQRRDPVGLRRIQIASGDEISGKEGPISLQRPFGVLQRSLRLFHVGFGGLQIGAGLRDLRLGKRRIDLRQQLTLFDRGIEIHEDLLDGPRNLGSHQHGRHRAHRSRRGDRRPNLPPGHLHRLELNAVLPVLQQVKSPACQNSRQNQQHQHLPDSFFHGSPTALSRPASAIL